jgi:hypothetical protein
VQVGASACSLFSGGGDDAIPGGIRKPSEYARGVAKGLVERGWGVPLLGSTVSVMLRRGVEEGTGVRVGITLQPTSSRMIVQMSRSNHPGWITDNMEASIVSAIRRSIREYSEYRSILHK